MNEHEEVRELLELAAVEPGGLDRLEAGDTPAATLVVGPPRRVPGLPRGDGAAAPRRDAPAPDPGLASPIPPCASERSPSCGRSGVARGAGGAADAPVPAAPPVRRADPRSRQATSSRRRSVGIPAWAGTLAAALVIGLVGGRAARRERPSGRRRRARRRPSQAVAGETAALMAADDVARWCCSTRPVSRTGRSSLSPSVGRILVTATGLDEPAAGTEYRCWVDGGRCADVDRDDALDVRVAWWTGDVTVPADFPPGVVYGVSLAEVGSSDPGTVVLTGGP